MKAVVRALIKTTRYEIRRTRHNNDSIHFLHIGKNAGTQVFKISQQINDLPSKRKIIKHGHDIGLNDIPQRYDYFFSVRDPISRFKSGFLLEKT